MRAPAWLLALLVACLALQGICPVLCGPDLDLDLALTARAALPEPPCHAAPMPPGAGSPEDHSSACARCQDARPATVSSAPETAPSVHLVALAATGVEAPTFPRRHFAAPWARPERTPPDLLLLHSTLLL